MLAFAVMINKNLPIPLADRNEAIKIVKIRLPRKFIFDQQHSAFALCSVASREVFVDYTR